MQPYRNTISVLECFHANVVQFHMIPSELYRFELFSPMTHDQDTLPPTRNLPHPALQDLHSFQSWLGVHLDSKWIQHDGT